MRFLSTPLLSAVRCVCWFIVLGGFWLLGLYVAEVLAFTLFPAIGLLALAEAEADYRIYPENFNDISK